MAKNETRRLRPIDLLEDEEVYHALKDINNYASANADYAMADIDTTYDEWQAAKAEEAQAAANPTSRNRRAP